MRERTRFLACSAVGSRISPTGTPALAQASISSSSSEAGVPGYEVTGWGGLIVPGATPKSIVARLNTEINAALPHVTEKLTSLGSEVAGGTPEQFAEFIRKETIKWGDVVKRAGIKID